MESSDSSSSVFDAFVTDLQGTVSRPPKRSVAQAVDPRPRRKRCIAMMLHVRCDEASNDSGVFRYAFGCRRSGLQ